MNLENVEDMGYAFSGCSSLTDINFGEYNAEKLKDTSYTFSGCNQLANLDISKFNPKSLEKVSYMFNWSNRLKKLDISQLDFSNVIDPTNVFNKLPKDAVVYVKNNDIKQWILSLPLTSRPEWNDSNIIIK